MALGVAGFGKGAGPVFEHFAEFVPLAGGVGAELVQFGGGAGAQPLELAGCVLTDPGGFGGGSLGAGLGHGGPLPGLLGFLALLPGFGNCGVPGGLDGLDSIVALGLYGGNALLGVAVDAVDLGGVGGGGLGEPVVGLAGLFFFGGQQCAHLLGGVVGVGAHLAGDGGLAFGFGSSCFGGCGALLGRRPGRLRLRLRPRWGRSWWPRFRLLPGAENSDEGGARDTHEEPDKPGGLVGEVPGFVGEVPGWDRFRP